jgi:hypothetical protein
MRLPTSLSNTMRVNLGMLLIVLTLFAVAPQRAAKGAPAATPVPVCLASPGAAQQDAAHLTVDSAADPVRCP